MIGFDRKIITPKQVLLYADVRAAIGAKPTYIICGRSGPTGKTWLTNELRKAGHTAIEISESINPFVHYRDDENHMLELGFDQIVVMLNKPLPVINPYDSRSPEDVFGKLIKKEEL